MFNISFNHQLSQI